MSKVGVIKDIEKGRGEVVRIEISEYKGATLFNIRIWYQDSNGEFKPTQKGISVSPDLIPEIKEALEEAERRLA